MSNTNDTTQTHDGGETVNHNEALRKLGFSIETSCHPRFIGTGDSEDWGAAHVRYDSVSLKFKDTVILTTSYKLGVGHLPQPKMTARGGSPHIIIPTGRGNRRLTFGSLSTAGLRGVEQLAFATTTHRCRYVEGSFDPLWNAITKEYVKMGGVFLVDVAGFVSSMLLDATPVLWGYTFPDWCSDYGYETDSIKAKTCYDECVQIGVQMKAIPQETLEAAQEILTDY